MNQFSTTAASPFGNIGLSLSGGGYRAAGFHLGAMDMLERLDLLKDVSTLSTVSGGTFTGMKYALALKAGISFLDFYNEFQTKLQTVDLPALAFQKLSRATPSTPSGRWDLITAFAQVYDEKLFGGERFGIFWNKEPIRITELIFNATEFRTGVAFRFRKSENPNVKIGNGNVFITPEQAQHIRIADIVAASSCFPGGFEPLNFPEDFVWPGNQAGADALAQLRKNKWAPLPLMDGGVYDNQGMGSLMLEADLTGAEFGLFVFSDTDQNRQPLYSFPTRHPPGWLRLGHVNVLWWLFLLFTVATAVVSLKFTEKPWNAFPLAMSLVTAAAIIWVRLKVTSSFSKIPSLGLNAWKYVRKLKVNQFIDMLESRASSLFALAGSVFMRRVRRMIFDSIYNDPQLRPKLVSNLIYGLLEHHPPQSTFEWLEPSDAMRKLATAANAMPTTLWFTDPQQLKDLVSCGQMSMCHKLLLHIVSAAVANGGVIPMDLQATFERSRELFLKLKQNPYCLFEETPPRSV
jgi:predicted acylesterase/phospholipase RssA